MNPKYKILNAYHLKIIAFSTMFIDHFGAVFLPDFSPFRIIGRISFVLFSFLLVEGFIHTSNIRKYLAKMGIWALISEVPYDLAINGSFFDLKSQNIFFTLFFGLLTLCILRTQIDLFIKIILVLCISTIATFCAFDYYFLGIIQIVLLYIFRKSDLWRTISVSILNLVGLLKISVQAYGFLGTIPILFYNGQQGKKTGTLLYSFYAIHLLIFGVIKYYLF